MMNDFSTADVIKTLQLIRCLFLCVLKDWYDLWPCLLISQWVLLHPCLPEPPDNTYTHTLMMLDVTHVGRWPSSVWTGILTLGPLWPAAPAGPGGPWETHYTHMSAHVYTYICAFKCLYDSLSLLSSDLLPLFSWNADRTWKTISTLRGNHHKTSSYSPIQLKHSSVHHLLVFLSPSGPDVLGNLANLEHPAFPKRTGTGGIKSEKMEGKKKMCVLKGGLIFCTDYYWLCCSRLFYLFSSDACGSRFTQGTTLPFGALRTVLTAHPWSTQVSLTDTDGVNSMF